jgi:hypothetical protein
MITMAFFGALIVAMASQESVIAPFIYALF